MSRKNILSRGIQRLRMKTENVSIVMLVLFFCCTGLPSAQASTVGDIENNRSEAAVETVMNLGIAGGYPDELFGPDQLVTRAEFVRMLVDAGWVTPAKENIKPTFKDVGREHWAFPYVEAAAAAGYVAGEGYPERVFEPEREITISEMSAMVGRLMAGEHLPGVPAGTGIRQNNWVMVVKEAGILCNYPDGTRGEDSGFTRAEACAVILRLKQKLLAAEVDRERRWLTSVQSPDGSMSMAGGRPDVTPYFGNLTEMAQTGQPQDLAGLKKYLEWSLSNLNYPDRWGLNGTIYDRRLEGGVLQSVYGYDSADSYAATSLTLAATYQLAAGDLSFIREHYRDLSTEAELIISLQDSDGLVWAKPSLPVKYLMDNCECYRGLKDWSELLAELGFKELSSLYDNKAESIKKGILAQFWDEETASFVWAVDQEGKKAFPSRGHAYPGFFAQIYPVTFGVISPASGKAILAYQKLNEELPRWPDLEVEDPFPWAVLGYTAVLMDDLPRADQFLKNCRFSYIMTGRDFPWSTFEDAFYIRACGALQEKIKAGLN